MYQCTTGNLPRWLQKKKDNFKTSIKANMNMNPNFG